MYYIKYNASDIHLSNFIICDVKCVWYFYQLIVNLHHFVLNNPCIRKLASDSVILEKSLLNRINFFYEHHFYQYFLLNTNSAVFLLIKKHAGNYTLLHLFNVKLATFYIRSTFSLPLCLLIQFYIHFYAAKANISFHF